MSSLSPSPRKNVVTDAQSWEAGPGSKKICNKDKLIFASICLPEKDEESLARVSIVDDDMYGDAIHWWIMLIYRAVDTCQSSPSSLALVSCQPASQLHADGVLDGVLVGVLLGLAVVGWLRNKLFFPTATTL